MSRRRSSPQLRSVTVDDWAAVRALRLDMLRDTPGAFRESLADASALSEADWRARANRSSGYRAHELIASDGERDVGTMRTAYAEDHDPWPTLYGVYVAPNARGRRAGVADALLDGIEAWARERAGGLRLEVHDDNPRAEAFYLRRGYRRTGVSVPAGHGAGRLLEMCRPVDAGRNA